MAIPSLTGYQVLDDADNSTDGVYVSSGTVGGTSVGNPNTYNAPYTASHASLSTGGTGNAATPNYWGKRFSHSSHNFTDRLLAITLAWTQHLTDTKANGGLVIAMNSASGGNRSWSVSGYQGVGQAAAGGITWEDPNTSVQPQGAGLVKWRTFIIDSDKLDGANTSGTFSITNITSIEIRTSFRTAGAMQIPINKIVSIDKISIINGEVSTPATVIQLVSLLRTVLQSWLVFDLQNTQYFFITRIGIGDGSTLTYFVDSDKSIVFATGDSTSKDPYTYIFNNNELGFTVNNSGSDYIRISRFQMSSVGKWHFNVLGSSSADCLWTGGSITNLGTNSLEGSLNFSGVTFANCDRLNPSSNKSFERCSIVNSTSNSAFLWDGTQEITRLTISGGTYGLEITDNGIYNLDSNTFIDCIPFYVLATGLVEIVVDSDSTTDVIGGFGENAYVAPNGATVTFVLPSPTITFIVTFDSTPPSDYEWWLYETDDTPGVIGTNELTGNETETETILTYTYTDIGLGVSLQIIATGYIERLETLTLPASSQSFNIRVSKDPNL